MSRRLATIALIALALASPARAGEFYYAMIFGSDSSPRRMRYAHTWATFIKATGEGTDPNGYAIELRTISWMPRRLDVRVLNPVPEPGVNVDLYQTLAIEYGHGDTVTMWGPFTVLPMMYERAGRVASVLESGQSRYRAISGMDILTGDCIHAVAAVDPVFGRGHYPLIRIGKPASRYIARQAMMRSVFDQDQYDNSWLIPRLGLDRYPIEVVPPRAIPKRGCALCLIPE
jgi:hypothetical protein